MTIQILAWLVLVILILAIVALDAVASKLKNDTAKIYERIAKGELTFKDKQ